VTHFASPGVPLDAPEAGGRGQKESVCNGQNTHVGTGRAKVGVAPSVDLRVRRP